MAEIKEITPLFLTAQGLKLQAKVQAGLTKLEITDVVIGYGYLDDATDKEQLIELIHKIPSHATGSEGTGAIVDVTRLYNDEGTGVAIITVEVSNADNDYTYLREFGFMANDPDNGTILYGVANLGDDALPLPTYDGKAHVVYECDFPTIISNSDNVTVNITKPAEVKRAEFDGHKTKAVIDHPDKSVTSEKIQDSVALRGKPTAPTADSQTNDMQIATTAFVQAIIKDIQLESYQRSPMPVGRWLNSDTVIQRVAFNRQLNSTEVQNKCVGVDTLIKEAGVTFKSPNGYNVGIINAFARVTDTSNGEQICLIDDEFVSLKRNTFDLSDISQILGPKSHIYGYIDYFELSE